MNILQLNEARAIAKHKGFGGNVPDSLYRLALRTLSANKPMIIYAPIDWFADDGSESVFDEMTRERNEKLQYAEQQAQEWNDR